MSLLCGQFPACVGQSPIFVATWDKSVLVHFVRSVFIKIFEKLEEKKQLRDLITEKFIQKP